MSLLKRTLAFVGMGALLAASVLAQDSNSPANVSAVAGTEREARLQAVAADREGAIAGLMVRWAGGTELRAALDRLDAETLLAAQEATSVEALNAVLFHRGEVDPHAGIGDDTSHLVFFPVTPCRIIDTRVAGGALAAGVPREFDAQGPFGGQGGSATTCGLPGSDPAALAITLTAVSPAGAGNLRAWPQGGAAPNASVVNYAAVAGLNLANTTILPLRQDVAQTNEFTIQADVAAAHVVADVVGYFEAGNVSTVSEGTGAVLLPDDTCRLVTSCTVSNPNAFARNALAIGTGNFRVSHTTGTHDEGTIRLSTSATPTCANFPLVAGDAKFDVGSAVPTGCCFEGEATAAKTFPVPANSSITVRMYAAMVLGAGGTDEVARGTLQCLLP